MIQHIYADDSIRFDLADVQHIEHIKGGGLQIIFKSTRWNFEKDFWDNMGYIKRNEQRFLTEWHNYKNAMQKQKEK